MSSDLKLVAASVASIISFSAYIPYLRDMVKRKTKPHVFTWLTFFLVTITVAIQQVAGGAGYGVVPTFVAAIINAVILVACVKYGTKDIVLLDKICLAISIVGILAFILLQDQPLVSLTMVTIAEIASFIPTFRKTSKDPYSESLPYYYLVLIKISLILVALKSYNLQTIMYPISWGIVLIIFLISMYGWRLQKPRTH